MIDQWGGNNILLGQDEKVLSNRTPRRQNLDKKIGVIRQKKTSQQQVQPSAAILKIWNGKVTCLVLCSQVISKKEEEELLALSPQPSIGDLPADFYLTLILIFPYILSFFVSG